MNRHRVIHLHSDDNVAIAANVIRGGSLLQTSADSALDSASGDPVIASTDIHPGHKIALVDIDVGEWVRKYGQPIGRASTAIRRGEHVHCHNLVDDHSIDARGLGIDPPSSPPPHRGTFEGYVRGDGRVATRNYIAIISTVNCSATVCHRIVEAIDQQRRGGQLAWPENVDGVFAATHAGGCAMQFGGEKHEMLTRVLRGYRNHPNVAAAVVVGLGCEQTTAESISDFAERSNGLSDNRVQTPLEKSVNAATPFLTIQSTGGTAQTIRQGVETIRKLLPQAAAMKRQVVDAKHLHIAMECGGSDGYSGWTANPVLGTVTDRVVAAGGTSVVSETTELYGAEHLLVPRFRDHPGAVRFLDRLEWWKRHVATYGGTLDHNPSVGNKAGGLSTITEKSLGAASKTGSVRIEDFVAYGHRIDRPGLHLMDSPGFDPSSVTGKVAGGANLVLFSTGRGSCFGCKPVPVIKVATHDRLMHQMPDDMDFSAGGVLHGQSVEDVGASLWKFALEVASGRATHSERLGLGDHEFVPWTIGPVL